MKPIGDPKLSQPTPKIHAVENIISHDWKKFREDWCNIGGLVLWVWKVTTVKSDASLYQNCRIVLFYLGESMWTSPSLALAPIINNDRPCYFDYLWYSGFPLGVHHIKHHSTQHLTLILNIMENKLFKTAYHEIIKLVINNNEHTKFGILGLEKVTPPAPPASPILEYWDTQWEFWISLFKFRIPSKFGSRTTLNEINRRRSPNMVLLPQSLFWV